MIADSVGADEVFHLNVLDLPACRAQERQDHRHRHPLRGLLDGDLRIELQGIDQIIL